MIRKQLISMEENNGFLQIDKFSQLTRAFSNQKKAIVYFFLRLFKPNIASCENQSFQLGLFEGKTGSFDFFINLTNLELGLQPTIRKKWPEVEQMWSKEMKLTQYKNSIQQRQDVL